MHQGVFDTGVWPLSCPAQLAKVPCICIDVDISLYYTPFMNSWLAFGTLDAMVENRFLQVFLHIAMQQEL